MIFGILPNYGVFPFFFQIRPYQRIFLHINKVAQKVAKKLLFNYFLLCKLINTTPDKIRKTPIILLKLNSPCKRKIEIKKTDKTLVEDANDAAYPVFGQLFMLCVKVIVAAIKRMDDIITAAMIPIFDNLQSPNKTFLKLVIFSTPNSLLIK